MRLQAGEDSMQDRVKAGKGSHSQVLLSLLVTGMRVVTVLIDEQSHRLTWLMPFVTVLAV